MATTVQIIETERGERVAIVPIAEYQRLMEIAAEHAANEDEEDEGTARVIAARRAAAAGRQLVPAEIAEALARGDNGIRAARKMRGLTQEKLAAAAGVGHAYLSQLETGERDGQAAILEALARVLGVDAAWLSKV